MAAYALRRAVGHVLLLALAASLCHLLAAACLRPRAEFEARSPRPPQRVIDAELTRLGLNDDRPLIARYAHWAAGVVRGDFGRTVDDRPVGAELGRRGMVSLRLLLPGAVSGAVIGVLLGGRGAIWRHRLGDRLSTVAAIAVLATPAFVLAIVLQTGAQWINMAAGSPIFAYVGEYAPGETGGPLAGLGDRLRHLLLPTLTTALGQIALYSRYQRTLLLDELRAGHVRAAHARGVRPRTALRKYALRPTLVPVAIYVAYQAGPLLTGMTLTEKVFGWHGMGEWLVDSIARGDVNAVAAIGCCAAVLVFTARLLADVLAAAIDPRVRR
ncbi:MAG TPA: ABC transporter permease [Streptosporangiaceae bacterium]|jgi:peptide/nickel transport system permease protein|nr:ABC transporter permease [Streptosporangiaceae bacterium]